jgi:hypothetical protein
VVARATSEPPTTERQLCLTGRASKVTANYSLHSARSLGDRVMGLLDRPEATKGWVGKVKDTLRATYGQGWPHSPGAQRRARAYSPGPMLSYLRMMASRSSSLSFSSNSSWL